VISYEHIIFESNQLSNAAQSIFHGCCLCPGALHAMEPGHGKAVMAAFVMGTDANLGDTLLLGGTVVFAHVIVVILLGVASFFLEGSLNVNNPRPHECNWWNHPCCGGSVDN